MTMRTRTLKLFNFPTNFPELLAMGIIDQDHCCQTFMVEVYNVNS